MTRFASERRGNDWKGAAGGAKRSEHGTPGKRDGDVRSRAAQIKGRKDERAKGRKGERTKGRKGGLFTAIFDRFFEFLVPLGAEPADEGFFEELVGRQL